MPVLPMFHFSRCWLCTWVMTFCPSWMLSHCPMSHHHLEFDFTNLNFNKRYINYYPIDALLQCFLLLLENYGQSFSGFWVTGVYLLMSLCDSKSASSKLLPAMCWQCKAYCWDPHCYIINSWLCLSRTRASCSCPLPSVSPMSNGRAEKGGGLPLERTQTILSGPTLLHDW